jgi:hypothetical protein
MSRTAESMHVPGYPRAVEDHDAASPAQRYLGGAATAEP